MVTSSLRIWGILSILYAPILASAAISNPPLIMLDEAIASIGEFEVVPRDLSRPPSRREINDMIDFMESSVNESGSLSNLRRICQYFSEEAEREKRRGPARERLQSI